MLFNPNNIITVIPRKEWKPLEVTIKATGEKQIIKDYRFNPELHENAKEVLSEVLSEVKVEVKPEVETPTDENVGVITPAERFAFLKSKGYIHLDASEKKNYSELKKQLEK